MRRRHASTPPRTLAARALIAAVLTAVPAPARSTGAAFGVGVASVRVSSDALTRDVTETGYSVFGSYRLSERVSVHLAVTGVGENLPTRETTDIFYPPDRAELSVLDLRLRLDLLPLSTRRFSPWVEAGAGLVTLNWQRYFYMQQGLAASFAAGFDVRLVAGLFLRGAVSHVGAGTSDTYGHATPDLGVTSVLLSAGYQLGWPPLAGGGAASAPTAAGEAGDAAGEELRAHRPAPR